jgi:hypothetical protein
LFLAEALLLGAILSGWGRAFGAPMLFWDQRKGRQFLAGLSVTLFMCDGILVTYWLEPPGRASALRLEPLLIASPLALLTGVAMARTIRRVAGSFGVDGQSSVAPAVNDYNGTEPTRTRPEIPVWPFLGGSLVALAGALSIEQFGSHAAVLRSPPFAIFFVLTVAFIAFRRIATPAVAICVLLAAAMESVMLFRNDGQLGTVAQIYRNSLGTEDALATTVFEFSGDASLSWHLTKEEKGAIGSQVRSTGIAGKVKAIDAWLAPPRSTREEC